jgi:adenylate kinase family enzyme
MASALAHDSPMRRVLVVGNGGAGKTTFARRLGEKLKLPVIHLDPYFWRPGWQPPEQQAWREQLTALVAASEWIMEGNYINTFDIRLPRADSLVWLDYPRAVCMRRVLWRTLKGYGRTRPDLPKGCPERFDLEFLHYVWNFPRQYRPRVIAGIEQFGGHLHVTRLGSDGEVGQFLAGVGVH